MDDPNITMEEYIRLEEEKAHRRGKVYNWETAMYGTIKDNEDVHDLESDETEFPAIIFNYMLTSEATLSYYFKDFEKEFPAIVYNDAQTSKLDFLIEPTVCPQHVDEFNLKSETSLSECDEEEQNVLYFNDLFPFNVSNPGDSKSDKDNEDDKIDIEESLKDLSVKPLPNVINTDVGAYAHGSNKILETSMNTAYPREWIQCINFLYSFRPRERKTDDVGEEFTKLEILKCWSLETSRQLFNTRSCS
ncbi:hypothetical protein Tco_0226894 [Tanacetum coccineum]